MNERSQTEMSDAHSVERLNQLVARADMINLVHEGLRRTLKVEELFPIILGTAISPRGLGFSRAFLLRRSERADSFEICGALGAVDREGNDRVRAAVAEEEKGFSAGTSAAEPGAGGPPEDEESIFTRHVEDIRDETFWATIARQFDGCNALLDDIVDTTLPDQSMGSEGRVCCERFIDQLFRSKTCLMVPAEKLQEAPFPDSLKNLLPGNSLWAGIDSDKGTRLMLVVDKCFEDAPIDPVDQLHMNWFCSQVAMAIENAELISDLKATNEALQELDTLKSNFLSTISHELRTPLTAITGFTRLLASNRVGELSPGQKQIMDRVLSHSERLVNVVNDLIEITEIDAGAAIIVCIHPIDPLNVLMETLPKLDPRRSTKGVTVEPVVTSPVPKISADEKALERIFYHLIDNAIKFSKEDGRVRIEFEVGEKELSVQIIDQGIGIPIERLRQIFEAFYQVDSHLARVYEGMGIGLTLTKKLIDSTGGRIVVRSEPDEGSTFTVVYPLA